MSKVLLRIKKLNGFDTIVKSILALFTRVFGAGTGFLVNLVITRNLSPDHAGYFFFLLSIVTITAMISTLGLGNFLLSEIPALKLKSNFKAINSIVSNSLSLTFTFALALSIFILLFSGRISSFFISSTDLSDVLSLSVLAVPLLALSSLYVYLFQSIHKPIIGIFLSSVFQPLIFCTLLYFGVDDLESILFSYIWSLLLTCLVMGFLWFRHEWSFFKLSFRLSRCKSKYQQLIPFFSMLLVDMLIAHFPILFAAKYFDPNEVAYFSVANRCATLISFILTAVNLVIVPKLTESFHLGDIREVKKLTRFSVRLMLLGALPLFLIFTIFPEHLLLLFGSSYKEASNLLLILAIGQMVNVLTGSVGYLLMMGGHSKTQAKIKFVAAFILILLLIVLTNLYKDISVVAWCVCISLVCSNLLSSLFVYKKFKFIPFG